MPNTKHSGCCPMDEILRLIMGPWTTYILWLLENEGELRFGELKKRMARISSKVLTERLRMLEEAGLVPRGHELKSVLKGIHNLALKWQAEDSGRIAAAE